MGDKTSGNWFITKHFKISYFMIGIIIFLGYISWLFYWIVIFGWLNIGYEEIGVLFEKKEYSAQYWVYLQPEDNKSKSYRLKGDIDRLSGDDYDYYMLNKVYWPSGGQLIFSDCNITNMIKEEVAENCITEDDNISYEVRLGEKVK